MPEQEKNRLDDDKVVFKTPPKIAFTMGILAGITATSVIGFIFMYSIAKSNGSFGGSSSANANTAKVAGATTNQANPTPTNTAPSAPIKADIQLRADDHVLGDKNAKVALVEYSDFQCPFCSRVKPTLDKIMTDYKGKVKLIFRHFPLTSLHENAQKSAEASECASEQGKFWEMHDQMFANQSALTADNLKRYAKDLGLNTSEFNSCLDEGKYAQKVKDDLAEGSNFGVEGTPATFVNGTLVSGAQPYEKFKSIIDSALAS